MKKGDKRAKKATSKTPKRYYRRLERFPEGTDRLDAQVRLPVTGEQLERWANELFPGGGMKAVVGYVILRYGAWEEAMDVARRTTDPRSAFRVAWALEWAYEQAAEEDIPEWLFGRLIDDFCTTSNGSLHRMYAKIICDRMRFGGASFATPVSSTDAQAGRLAEKCFDLVIDPRVGTAVKFWCLEILSELASRLDWVAEELPEILRRISETDDCSPGMRVATREILRRGVGF